jgi:hypothetical protein
MLYPRMPESAHNRSLNVKKRLLINAILILMIVFGFAGNCFSQEKDILNQMLTQPEDFGWQEAATNAKYIIPDLYARNQADSAIVLIDFIEKRYDLHVLGGFRLLRLAEIGELSVAACDTELFMAIFENELNLRSVSSFTPYQQFELYPHKDNRYYAISNTEIRKYDDFILNLADSLSRVAPQYSLERAICGAIVHKNDSLMAYLSQGKYKGTCLDSFYVAKLLEIQRELPIDRCLLSLSIGPYKSYGKADYFNTAPDIEFNNGIRTPKIGIGWGLGLYIAGENKPFHRRYNNDLSDVKYAKGVYGLAEFYYQCRKSQRSLDDLLVGLKFGELRFLSGDQERSSLRFDDLGLFLGLNHRYFYNHNRSKFISVEVRTAIVQLLSDYGDPAGASISLFLGWGSLKNGATQHQAEKLHYYDWKH